jgi:hypothetical protein
VGDRVFAGQVRRMGCESHGTARRGRSARWNEAHGRSQAGR